MSAVEEEVDKVARGGRVEATVYVSDAGSAAALAYTVTKMQGLML